MRKFSQLNLLNKKISNGFSKKNPFMLIVDSMFETKNVTLSVRIPHYDYLRGKVFIHDLEDILEEDLNDFSVENLFALLYYDFLTQIRQGADVKQIAKWLMQLKNIYREEQFEQVSEMVKRSDNAYTFVHREQLKPKKKEDQRVNIFITLSRKEVERGEVLLYDMSNLVNGFYLTVEELISHRYQDFIKEVKAGNESIIKAVLNNIRNRI